VVAALLAERPGTAGLLLVHGTGGEPADVPAGLPVHLYIAQPDDLFPPAGVAAWRDAMTGAGAVVRVHTYPGAGNLFADPDTTDFDQPAAELAWQRSLAFLGSP
jgi:dienelactone hydrolase